MTLRNKTLLIVGLSLAALFAAVFGGTALVLSSGFSELEHQQMRSNSVRAQLAIERELQHIDAVTHDYAVWDDAAAFVTGRNPEFVERFLTPDTFDNLKIDLIILADNTGQVRFSGSYDPRTREPTPLATRVQTLVNPRDGLLFNPNSTDGKQGILRAGSTLMLFGAHPILRHAGATANAGTLIIARVLDQAALDRLGEMIQLNLAVSSVVGDLEPDFAQAWNHLKHGESGPYLTPLGSDLYAAYHVLLDQARKPVALLRMTAPRAVHAQRTATLQFLLGALVVLGVIFIAITLVTLERTVLARLERITSEVSNIALGGDMTGRVTVIGTDELSALAQNINKLLGTLESQVDLEDAVSNAQLAAQAKSTFLANMSHELRTPLNAIIGYSELVQESVADKGLSGVEPDLKKIVEAARHLQSIIADVLDISKIEAGKMELDTAPCDVREIVTAVRDIVAVRAAEKNLDLFVHVMQSVPVRIVTDAARLRQILVNLANNAVKFTERGSVELLVEAKTAGIGDEWEVHFSVKDSGIGIPAQRFDRLFKAFSQVDPSSSRKYGGTGLGLAISKQLCEMMGGRMWAESIEGLGSTFHFTIRARLAA